MMWFFAKLIVICAFLFAPGWLFWALVGVFLYFAFYFSRPKALQNPNHVPLPTWFSLENYDHIHNNAEPTYKKVAETVMRMAAEIQSPARKKKQKIYVKTNSTVSHTQPTVSDKAPNTPADTVIHRSSSQACKKCGLVFPNGRPQTCHRADCVY